MAATDPTSKADPADLVPLVDSLVALPVRAGDADAAARLLIDHLVCRQTGAAALSRGAPADLGPPWPTSLAEAAGRDAELCHLGDRDDVHYPSLVHAGSVVWPVVLRLGAELGSSGRQLLRAVRVGYDTTARVALALGAEHRRRFHTTATCGALGAAAVAAEFLGLSRDRTADALAHAWSAMGGSSACLTELSDTRAFHRGHAVRTGLAAAAAARAGLMATRHDPTSGLGAAFAAVDVVSSSLVADQDALRTTSVRVFATSGWNQSVCAAAVRAAAQWSGSSDVAALHVRVQVCDAVLAPGLRNPTQRWVSVPAAVADTLRASGIDCPQARIAVDASELPVDRAVVRIRDDRVEVLADAGAAERSDVLSDFTRQAGKWGLPPGDATTLVSELAHLLQTDRPAADAIVARVRATLVRSKEEV
jgi:2-methylcitrate dehydratase PrpD